MIRAHHFDFLSKLIFKPSPMYSF